MQTNTHTFTWEHAFAERVAAEICNINWID